MAMGGVAESDRKVSGGPGRWPGATRAAAALALAVLTMAPALACEEAIARAEFRYGIPQHLLLAIGQVEAGLAVGREQVRVWPFTINASGKGRRFGSARLASAAVRDLRQSGVRLIDAGCLQVNLQHHPDAFATVDLAFDPDANADYGARFLVSLFAKHRSWDLAVSLYHTGEAGSVARRWPYSCRVYQRFARLRGSAPAVRTCPPF